MLDKEGLVTSQRAGLSATVRPFARIDEDEADGETLLSVVKRVKPTVLVRSAGQTLNPESHSCRGPCHAKVHAPLRAPTSKLCAARPRCCRAHQARRAAGRGLLRSLTRACHQPGGIGSSRLVAVHRWA